ncbi:hypothetical protein C8Q75DRAFT_737701 [Abortiporus biennis]|nr:hypothetical protein C8Q75DRAFT_737701 [Abortiporus biennis]
MRSVFQKARRNTNSISQTQDVFPSSQDPNPRTNPSTTAVNVNSSSSNSSTISSTPSLPSPLQSALNSFHHSEEERKSHYLSQLEYHNQQFEYAECERDQAEDTRAKTFREFLVETEHLWSQKQLEIGKELDECEVKHDAVSMNEELARDEISQAALENQEKRFVKGHERISDSFQETQRKREELAELFNKQREEVHAQLIQSLHDKFTRLLGEEDDLFREFNRLNEQEFLDAVQSDSSEMNERTDEKAEAPQQIMIPAHAKPVGNLIVMSSPIADEGAEPLPQTEMTAETQFNNWVDCWTDSESTMHSRRQVRLALPSMTSSSTFSEPDQSQFVDDIVHNSESASQSSTIAASPHLATHDDLNEFCKVSFTESQLCRQAQFDELQVLRNQLFGESQNHLDKFAGSRRSEQFRALHSKYQDRFSQDLTRRAAQIRAKDGRMDQVVEEKQKQFDAAQRGRRSRFVIQQNHFRILVSSMDEKADLMLRKANSEVIQLLCTFDDRVASELERMENVFEGDQEIRLSLLGLRRWKYAKASREHTKNEDDQPHATSLPKFMSNSYKHLTGRRSKSLSAGIGYYSESVSRPPPTLEPETLFTPRILIASIPRIFSRLDVATRPRSRTEPRPSPESIPPRKLSPLQLAEFLDSYTEQYNHSWQLREDEFESLQENHTHLHALAEMRRGKAFNLQMSEFKETSQKQVIEWTNRSAEIQGEWLAFWSASDARRKLKFNEDERKREDMFIASEETRWKEWETKLNNFQKQFIRNEELWDRKFVEWKIKTEGLEEWF